MSIINSLPFTLVNGQTADATQVMANFNTIVSSVNASAAANGANSDITSLSGLTTPLSIPQGGTGATTLGAAKIVVNQTGTAVVGNIPKFSNVNGRSIVDGYALGTAAGDVVLLGGTGDPGDLPAVNGAALLTLPQGAVVQTHSVESGTLAKMTAAIPLDNTIPQITEGTEVLSLTVTPKSAAANIVFNGVVFGGNAAGAATVVVAVFGDYDVSALATVAMEISTGATPVAIPFSFVAQANNVAARTYSVRVGISAGTFSFNGANGAQLFGGQARSILTYMEIAP